MYDTSEMLRYITKDNSPHKSFKLQIKITENCKTIELTAVVISTE